VNGFLLDTCAISEIVRKSPNSGLIEWLGALDEEVMFLSALTMGQIRKGIDKLPVAQQKRTQLEAWLTAGLRLRFSGRIISFDADVADRWGRLIARLELAGRTISVSDSIIAASALHHDLIVVTRDEEHFTPTGVSFINPWK